MTTALELPQKDATTTKDLRGISLQARLWEQK